MRCSPACSPTGRCRQPTPRRTAVPAAWRSFSIQCQGVAATLVYSGLGPVVLLYVPKALVGLRVNEEEEREGLDLSLHGEQIF